MPHQPRRVALVLAGDADRGGWWGPGRPADWSDAVGAARALGAALAVDLTVAADEHAPWHPGRCARITLADGTLVGHAGELHPKALAALGLPARTCAAELDVDVLSAASDTVVAGPQALDLPGGAQRRRPRRPGGRPRRPRSRRRCARGTGDLLESLSLFDVYTGDQVGDQHKSLAYRLEFRAPDRTLTTEEVNGLRDRAIASAAAATGAVQRGA